MHELLRFSLPSFTQSIQIIVHQSIMPSNYLSFYKDIQPWLPLIGAILAAIFSALWTMLMDLPTLLITQLRRHYFNALWDRIGSGSDQNFSAAKTSLLSQARGTILDIGAGHGHSLKYLPRAQITRVISLEPNELMHSKIAVAAASAGFSPSQVEITNVPIEQILTHYPAGTIDTVYCNLVLCSVQDSRGAIGNIYQLLKPGGKFMFLEHVRAEDTESQKNQDWISQYWCWFFGGCRLNKPIDMWVREFGWTEVEIKPLYAELEKGTFFWHVVGVCTK